MRSKKIRNLFTFVLVLSFSCSLTAFAAEKLYGIQIEGQPEFVKRTKAALEILKNGRSIETVQMYVGIIRESERSGMRAYLEPPVYEVGKATWSAGDLWYASTIAHDSYHSLLFHEAKKREGKNPDDSVWMGADAERKCLKFQEQVLVNIGAEKRLIDYVRDLKKNPTYQGNPQSDEDYKKRWW